VKYKPCFGWNGAIRRDSVCCDNDLRHCMHNYFPDRFLRVAMKEILNYLYREGFSENPNTDTLYHMKKLCEEYYTIVSEQLITQVIHAVSILYINHSVLMTCTCNAREDCVCVPIINYFSVEK
jgi:hypothetical protein